MTTAKKTTKRKTTPKQPEKLTVSFGGFDSIVKNNVIGLVGFILMIISALLAIIAAIINATGGPFAALGPWYLTTAIFSSIFGLAAMVLSIFGLFKKPNILPVIAISISVISSIISIIRLIIMAFTYGGGGGLN